MNIELNIFDKIMFKSYESLTLVCIDCIMFYNNCAVFAPNDLYMAIMNMQSYF